MSGGLTRRMALQLVGGMTAALYGAPGISADGQRGILLALDDVQQITLRYRGRTATISPGELLDALGGTTKKEDA